jgi:hypothetical protein
MNLAKYEKSKYKGQIKATFELAQQMRLDPKNPQEVSFEEVVETKMGITLEDLYIDLGIDPTVDTISAIFLLPEAEGARWLVPEIIRGAIRAGLRDAPIWPQIISSEQDSSQLKVTMPYINMSNATPRKVGEAETISVGSISYGQKEVSVFKIGRGIKIPYEVIQFVSIDVISIFMQDFGVKLGQSMDTMAIDTLINGDQADGSESAPVIGVSTAGTKVYKDFLRIWIRGSRMGRNFTTIIGGEDSALETLDLPEFKDKSVGTTEANLNLKTPVPNSADYFIHGNVATDQEIMVDKRFALVKFNVIPLNIESEKIVSNQTLAFYASLTTGFGKLFLDASVILDKSDTIANLPFPSYMDVDALQDVVID